MRSSLLLLILVLSVSTVSAQQLKTVTDYFLAFPSDTHEIYSRHKGEELKPGPDLEKYRRSLIKVEDVKNGFLRLEGEWEGWAEFALFKKTDGSYLVGSNFVGCGPACDSTLFFFENREGKWIDVSSEVFEAPNDDEVMAALKRVKSDENSHSLFYTLPRKGTDITLECSMCKGDQDLLLFTFSWKSPKFIRK